MIFKALLPLSALGLLAVATSLPAAPAAPGPDGATLFRQRCSSCHAVVPGAKAVLGPNLAGLVGRKAAATPFAYSPALKASGVVWTKPNLDKFLAGPTKMVPGTRMVIAVSDAQQRAAILNYLTKPAK